MLLGVCLLTSGDFGRRLVFAFPPPANSPSSSPDAAHANATGPTTSAGVTPQDPDVFSVSAASSRASSVRSFDCDCWGLSSSEFIRLLSPLLAATASRDAHLVDVSVDAVRFLSFPIRLPSESMHELAAFTLVFVLTRESTLRPRDGVAIDAAPPLSALYASALQRLSRALEHEQHRCAFLSVQSTIIQAAREKRRLSTGAGVGGEVDGDGAAEILTESALARHLADIYAQSKQLERNFYVAASRAPVNVGDVSADTLVHVAINDWIYVDFTLAPRDFRQAPPIRPYQTLLLTASQSSLLRTLPADSAPMMAAVITRVNPARSLLQMASDLAVPLPSLLEIAKHLVQWGKARIIDALDDSQRFTPVPAAITQARAAQFARLFPGSSLPLFLAALTPPRSLRTHLARRSSEAKHSFRKQIVWALENEAIQALQTFLYAVDTRRPTGSVASDGDAVLDGDGDGPDARNVSRVNWSDARWFAFIRYEFGDGQVTLTEVAWQLRAHLTPKRLEAIVARDPSKLVTVTRGELSDKPSFS